MNPDRHDLTFVPVTRDQARFFGQVAAACDRRGMTSAFVAPSAEIATELASEWADLVHTTPPARSRKIVNSKSEYPTCDIPPEMASYDAWRHGWSEEQRVSAARTALRFWRDEWQRRPARGVVLWNGRDHLFAEAAAHTARQSGADAFCMELGPLRRRPFTLAISRDGVNAAACLDRPDKLGEALAPWERTRLEQFLERFRAGVRPYQPLRPYVFLPLQVDDDTQLFHYCPHFRSQEDVVRAVVDALPEELPLVLKLHPRGDERRGRHVLEPLLRQQDRIVSPRAETLGLLAGAAAVVTVNSSAGIEALAFDRPVVVLGTAHYAGRDFTFDFDGSSNLAEILRAATATDGCLPAARDIRDRYLYELFLHELVLLRAHPLRAAPSAEVLDRVAIRIGDLLAACCSQSDERVAAGSNWSPMIAELLALRDELRGAVAATIGEVDATALLMSRVGAAVLGDPMTPHVLMLEDAANGGFRGLAEQHVTLFAPELSPGQRHALRAELSAVGAASVRDVLHALSRQRCSWPMGRLNALPADLRAAVYRNSDYWDHYALQAAESPTLPTLKRQQAETLTRALAATAPPHLLDYGCGAGYILQEILTARAWTLVDAVGVDSSERMLHAARRRLRGCDAARLLPADARAGLPFANAQFDATLTCGTLQHVLADDLPLAVRELLRVTRRTLLCWEADERLQPRPGDHYTNPATCRTVHALTFDRCGPVELRVRDAQELTGQNSLCLEFDLDRPQLTVLTLHAVGRPDPTCESHDYRNLFVSLQQFEELIDGLLAGGYRFLTLHEATVAVRDETRCPPKSIVLTFDDGYASVFTHAYPLLARRGIRAAAFVVTDCIGRTFDGNSRRDPFGVQGLTDQRSVPQQPTMTADQLRTLVSEGWDVGSHSCSHPAFATLKDEQAGAELTHSRLKLESVLRHPVPFFTFPFGEPDLAYRPEHLPLAAEAGYELALTMRPGFVTPGRTTSGWPRIGVGCDTTPESLLADMEELHRRVHGWPSNATESQPSLRDRVRRLVQHCLSRGISNVLLYGAGRHTARLLQTAPLWPLRVLGIVDNDPGLTGTQRYGLRLHSPAEIETLRPDAVVISSDRYEDAIYERIAPLESRGIPVLRLYAPAAAGECERPACD